MKTVHEISDLTGLSIRTLQYYDNIGLLKPAQYSASGYRLYDDDSLTVLQQIMLFRELEFPLKDIKTIISDPDFDKNKALEDQIELLRLKRDHIDKLIVHTKKMLEKGENAMSFDVYDPGAQSLAAELHVRPLFRHRGRKESGCGRQRHRGHRPLQARRVRGERAHGAGRL